MNRSAGALRAPDIRRAKIALVTQHTSPHGSIPIMPMVQRKRLPWPVVVLTAVVIAWSVTRIAGAVHWCHAEISDAR